MEACWRDRDWWCAEDEAKPERSPGAAGWWRVVRDGSAGGGVRDGSIWSGDRGGPAGCVLGSFGSAGADLVGRSFGSLDNMKHRIGYRGHLTMWSGGADSEVRFGGEFDPGSGSTLAACLMHASRTGWPSGCLRGGRVRNTWATCPLVGASPRKRGVIPHTLAARVGVVRKGLRVADGGACVRLARRWGNGLPWR